MALPTIFNNLSAGNQPASLLDTNFNAVAAMGILDCSASGINTIALTQLANQAAISAYANYLSFSFVAAGNSTSSVTINVNGIGALNLYLADGVTQAGAGALASGVYYEIIYNSALNSSNGGFQFVSLSAVLPVLTLGYGSVINTPSINDNSTKVATTAYFDTAVQRAVLASNFTVTSNTLSQAVTGMQLNIVNGGVYQIEGVFDTTSISTAGIKITLGSSSGATSSSYRNQVIAWNSSTPTFSTNTTNLGGAFDYAVTAVTAAKVFFYCTLTCSASGPLTLYFAQNVSQTTGSVMLAGSYLKMLRVS